MVQVSFHESSLAIFKDAPEMIAIKDKDWDSRVNVLVSYKRSHGDTIGLSCSVFSIFL